MADNPSKTINGQLSIRDGIYLMDWFSDVQPINTNHLLHIFQS